MIKLSKYIHGDVEKTHRKKKQTKKTRNEVKS